MNYWFCWTHPGLFVLFQVLNRITLLWLTSFQKFYRILENVSALSSSTSQETIIYVVVNIVELNLLKVKSDFNADRHISSMSLWKDSAHIFPSLWRPGSKTLKEKSGEWQTGGVGEKEKNRKVGVVPLGSKASCLPSTLGHSLNATLAFGGMGVNCHWCHSAVNHAVTRSDGLRVVERKPPAKRHRDKKSPPVYPHKRATWLAN